MTSTAHDEGGDRRALWLLLPVGLLYAFTFVIPLAIIAVYSVATYDRGVTTLGLSLANYHAFVSDGVTLKIFWRTVRLAVLITAACLAIGYPVALYMARLRGPLRLLLLALVVSPLLTSVIVRNVAWLLVLGRTGLINTALQKLGLVDGPLPLMYNELGVVIAVVHVYLSFMVLPIFAALVAIEPSVEESASSLGASPFRVFRHVTLPLSTPGVAAGCSIVFILSMGIYLTPVIMGGSFVVTLPMVITELVRNQFNWATASAFAVVLLAFVGALMVASGRLAQVRGASR